MTIELLLLQFGLMVWAFFTASQFGFILARSREKPINMVARVFAKVIHQHWPDLRGRFDRIARIPEGLRFMQLAQDYLSRRAAGIYTLELERSHSRAKYLESVPDTEPEEPLSYMAIGFIILALSIGAALLLAYLLELLQTYPSIVLGVAALITLLIWLSSRPTKPVPEFVPVVGPASDWEKWQPRSSKECEVERLQIFTAITGAGGGLGTELTSGAPELPAATDTALPAPPGLTELVLVNFPESLKEIRDEIVTLRRFHRGVFLSILILWFLVILGGLGVQIVWLKQPWSGSLGTLGFSLVIGGILWGFLPAVRTSHIALALYQSYQLELIQNLRAVADISEIDTRSVRRAEAWETFRSGLNKLWLQENRSSAFTANLFRKYSQGRSSSPDQADEDGSRD